MRVGNGTIPTRPIVRADPISRIDQRYSVSPTEMPITTEPVSRNHSFKESPAYESIDPKTPNAIQKAIAETAHRIAFINPGETLNDWVLTIVALVAQTSEQARPTSSPSEIEITDATGLSTLSHRQMKH